MQTVINLLILLSAWFTVEIQALWAGNVNKVVGGRKAISEEFPYMGSFRLRDIELCAAVIIKKQWVITAAHCTEGLRNRALTVIAGRLRKNKTEPNEQIISVEKYFEHKKYNSVTFENDISLLKMSKPFRFNSYVNSIKLPKDKQQEFFRTCEVTGWGKLKLGGDYATTLKMVSIKTISDEECRKSFKDFEDATVLNNMICTLAQGKSPCHGDSGGPLICQGDDGDEYLRGITSWGIDCANLPGVYTEVSYFLDWIKDIIENNS